MRLILQIHQASAAQHIQQGILVLAAVDILLQIILEGFGNGSAVGSILSSLLSLLSLSELGSVEQTSQTQLVDDTREVVLQSYV